MPGQAGVSDSECAKDGNECAESDEYAESDNECGETDNECAKSDNECAESHIECALFSLSVPCSHCSWQSYESGWYPKCCLRKSLGREFMG